MTAFLQIRTSKFPVLEGEESELVNPGTHGKAFALYLQEQLNFLGYTSPFVCCEDWGWWVEIKLPEKSIGLCCYRHHSENTVCDFVCSTSLDSNRTWSWKKFRMVDLGQQLNKLVTDISGVFEDDKDIKFIGQTSEFPF